MTPNTSPIVDPVSATLTPGLFASHASRGKWQMAAMHELIDEAVTDTITGRTAPVLILETPPRHGKSQYASNYLPAWYLGLYPDRQVILTSATAALAVRFGRSVRGIVREWGHLFGVAVSEDRQSADDWETTKEGGMRTAGVGGDVMGRGFHLGIIDDYLKNSEDAFSETIRDKQWEWWQSTFSTRLEPDGAIIVIATRWHQDDLIGRLLKAADEGEGLPVRRVRLPAIAEENDPLGREIGEALWPERWPLGSESERVTNAYGKRVPGLLMRKRMAGPFFWSSLYQQRPSRNGLTAWPDAYFDNHIYPEVWPDAFELSAMAVDPSKGKDSKKGDMTVIVFAGVSGGMTYVDAVMGRFPERELIRRFLVMYAEYNPHVVGFEANGFQELFLPLIHQQATEHGIVAPAINPIVNTGDKTLRISLRLGPLLAHERGGRQSVLRFKKESPGVQELVRQMRDFPKGDHDDGPDGLEMAIRLLQQASAANADFDEPDEQAYA